MSEATRYVPLLKEISKAALRWIGVRCIGSMKWRSVSLDLDHLGLGLFIVDESEINLLRILSRERDSFERNSWPNMPASDISAFNLFEVSSSGARIVYSSDVQSMAERTHGWGANLGIMGPIRGIRAKSYPPCVDPGYTLGSSKGELVEGMQGERVGESGSLLIKLGIITQIRTPVQTLVYNMKLREIKSLG